MGTAFAGSGMDGVQRSRLANSLSLSPPIQARIEHLKRNPSERNAIIRRHGDDADEPDTTSETEAALLPQTLEATVDWVVTELRRLVEELQESDADRRIIRGVLDAHRASEIDRQKNLALLREADTYVVEREEMARRAEMTALRRFLVDH